MKTQKYVIFSVSFLLNIISNNDRDTAKVINHSSRGEVTLKIPLLLIVYGVMLVEN